MDVEVTEFAPRGGGDAGEPLTHDMERVLGGEEQHAAGLRRLKSAQARQPTGHRRRQVPGQTRTAGARGVEPGSCR